MIMFLSFLLLYGSKGNRFFVNIQIYLSKKAVLFCYPADLYYLCRHHERIHTSIKTFCSAIQEVPCVVGCLQHIVGHTEHLFVHGHNPDIADSLQDQRADGARGADTVELGPCGKGAEQ
jgi:hypothetical protein